MDNLQQIINQTAFSCLDEKQKSIVCEHQNKMLETNYKEVRRQRFRLEEAIRTQEMAFNYSIESMDKLKELKAMERAFWIEIQERKIPLSLLMTVPLKMTSMPPVYL